MSDKSGTRHTAYVVAPTTTDRQRAWQDGLRRAVRSVQIFRTRVADTPELPDGPGDYLPRLVDPRLVHLLTAGGSAGPPVLVVTGPPSAGVTRTTAHAVRLARPNDHFMAVDDPNRVVLSELVERARRRAGATRRVLLWCDDAPLALLDQVLPDVIAACSDQGEPLVRMVFTVRWGLVALSRGELAAARFAPVVVAPLVPAEVVGKESHDVVAACGADRAVGRRIGELVSPQDEARAAFAGESGDVLRLAAVWHRLGIPTALDPTILAALRPDDAAGDLDGIVGTLVAQGWLRRTVRDGQRHLAPARVLVDLARLPSEDLLECIAEHLDHHARYVAARTMLAAGFDSLAAVMVADLDPDPLGAGPALRIARGFAGLERDREAAQWFAFVVAVGEEDQIRAAHRGLGLVFYRYDRLDRARRHLDQASDQLGVQVVLADIALRQGRVDDARELLVLLGRSRDPSLAAEAACQLGTLDSSTGRLDSAREAFTVALVAQDPAVVARARTGLAALPPRPDDGPVPDEERVGAGEVAG